MKALCEAFFFDATMETPTATRDESSSVLLPRL
jgi:hypothetical protein